MATWPYRNSSAVIGFLMWGVAMMVGGWALWRAGKRETAEVRV